MYSIYRTILLLCFTCLGGCSDDKAGLQEELVAISRYNSDPITVTGIASVVKTGTRLADPDNRITIEPLNPRDRAVELPKVFLNYSAQDRLMTKRAATADAYRKLGQAIYDLKVSETQTVRDRLGAADSIRVDAFLQNHTVQPARYLEDGTVQVDVSLALTDAVKLLKQNYVENN